MQQIGCASCLVQDLSIETDRRVADVGTVHGPARGIFNGLFAQVSPLLNPSVDGVAYPLLLPRASTSIRVTQRIQTDKTLTTTAASTGVIARHNNFGSY